jgi:hypothetical protein
MQENKFRGPLISLASVAALAAGLWLVDVSAERDAAAPQAPVVVVTSTLAPPPAPPPPNTPPPVSFPAKASYLAKVPTGTRTITLEITVAGDRAVAYGCDGRSVEAWLRGSATAGALAMTSKDGSSRLTGQLRDTSVVGTLSLGAKTWDFTANVVKPPAGLYVYQGSDVRTSWIVDGNGKVTGVARRADGSTSAAPELSADGVAVVDGRTVDATRVEDGNVVA